MWVAHVRGVSVIGGKGRKISTSTRVGDDETLQSLGLHPVDIGAALGALTRYSVGGCHTRATAMITMNRDLLRAALTGQ